MKVGVLMNPTSSDHRQVVSADLPPAAERLGLTLVPIEVTAVNELDAAFERAARSGANAIVVLGDPLIYVHRARVAGLAARQRLPAVCSFSENVDAGGLVSYGPSRHDLGRRAATYVDKILKGARPADLPVEQPTKFDLVINLKTADPASAAPAGGARHRVTRMQRRGEGAVGCWRTPVAMPRRGCRVRRDACPNPNYVFRAARPGSGERHCSAKSCLPGWPPSFTPSGHPRNGRHVASRRLLTTTITAAYCFRILATDKDARHFWTQNAFGFSKGAATPQSWLAAFRSPDSPPTF